IYAYEGARTGVASLLRTAFVRNELVVHSLTASGDLLARASCGSYWYVAELVALAVRVLGALERRPLLAGVVLAELIRSALRIRAALVADALVVRDHAAAARAYVLARELHALLVDSAVVIELTLVNDRRRWILVRGRVLASSARQYEVREVYAVVVRGRVS